MLPTDKKEQPSSDLGTGSSETAAQIAPQLLQLSNEFGKRFFRAILGRDPGPGDDERQFLLAIEAFYFAVCLTRRILTNKRGASQGGELASELRTAAYRLLFSVQPGAEKVRLEDYMGALEKGWGRASATYDKCTRPFPKNESDLMEGTLFWEFCKRMIQSAGAPNVDSMDEVMKISIELGDAVPKLLESAGLNSSG